MGLFVLQGQIQAEIAVDVVEPSIKFLLVNVEYFQLNSSRSKFFFYMKLCLSGGTFSQI